MHVTLHNEVMGLNGKIRFKKQIDKLKLGRHWETYWSSGIWQAEREWKFLGPQILWTVTYEPTQIHTYSCNHAHTHWETHTHAQCLYSTVPMESEHCTEHEPVTLEHRAGLFFHPASYLLQCFPSFVHLKSSTPWTNETEIEFISAVATWYDATSPVGVSPGFWPCSSFPKMRKFPNAQ